MPAACYKTREWCLIKASRRGEKNEANIMALTLRLFNSWSLDVNDYK